MSNDGETVKFSIGENEQRGGAHGGGDTPTGAVAAAASTCSGINEDTDEQHRPHQLFCEMDELQENVEWKEAARWLKFEEDVELGGRWSKPHVATLQLHSLFELRSCLVNGATLLDFPGDDLPSIVEALIDSCVRLKILEEPHKDEVRNALLLKHVHQHEKEFQKQLSNGEKKSFPFVKSLADLGKKVSHVDLREATSSTPPITAKPSSSLLTTSNIGPMNMSSANLKQSSTQPVFELTGSQARIPKVDSKQKDFLTSIGSTASVASNASTYNFKINQNFMRKIPTGAEASNVLVGEVDFLDYQFSAFVRLSRSVVLGDFTEVPVPTRFLFIILGPKGNITKYHEIGRSISTLMSDELFHDVAYKAKNKQELLDAFDLFLDQVTVLPPGEWDPKIRLDPPSKIPQKEERLERIAEVHKLNGSVQNGLKKSDEELHPHELDPGLTFTGRFCGGLIDDVKRKVPWFVSDFTDGLNFQCLSSILFMYFACLSPIITFGGLLGTATDFNMSAIESLVSGAVCGILYSLFAGQPMTIMGSTGPVLVFETIVNSFSKEHGIDYMGFRAWIGLWTALILIIIVVTDCSALVKYITRFTEESFATLIAFIFIKESVLKLLEIRKSNVFDNDPTKYVNQFVEANNTDCYRCLFKNEPAIGNSSFTTLPAAIPVNYSMLNEQECNKLGAQFEFSKRCQYTPDVFFVSVVLYIVTFSLAMLFRFFRTSRFFPSLVRSKVSDFGVVITIVIAVSLDSMLNFNTPKLIVPIKFETTIPTRGWFINPLQRNSDKLFWLVPAAIFPALLATILIFMDQHITAVIVNRKENKLKKSSGYHLDMLIVAITIAINSLLGIPWFVAATVLSINHVLSLKKESESSAPGEKPKFLGVIEQRLTGTVVFALIGSSVFLAKLLRKIPMPVLYGIFLYMGISSLNGIQFMHRIVLIFMPEKHQPDYIFLRHVRTFKVHIFTIIQILCLAMLFIIKMNKSISITFPLMVLALVGIRKLMDYMFTQKELSYLDDIMPEIVKRSKEDGKDVNEVDEFAVRKLPKNDSINITQELSKTHIWKELVSSDKQLEEEPKLFRRKSSKKRKMSLTLKDNNNSPNTSNNAAVPTSQPSSRTATSPNQKPSHTSIMMNSNIPAIDEDVPLMSSPGSNFGSSPVPQIVVFNSRTPAQSPIQENQTKL